jgi:1,5-anhydro-D-fructose reductase (1,5-anhydro-D-mannitol-forming)
MREIRDLIAAGGIGSVRLVQIELGPGRKLPQNWRTVPGLAGLGVMNNLGVHAYDLLRHLLGSEVVEATAVVDVEPGFEVDTLALALLRFGNGALAYVNANQSLPNPQQDLSVHGTEGTVLGRDVTRSNLTGSLSVTGRAGTVERAVSSAGAYVATVTDFADAVLEGREPSPSGLDGLRSVELTDALARSARERRSVLLSS